MIEACIQNQLCLVRALLDCGEDIDAYDGCIYTPLSTACASRNDEIVKLLIERGADVNKPTFSGFRPIHYACEMNSIECVRLLLDAGAEMNCGVNLCNITPLYLAVTSFSEEIVKELIDRGAIVNTFDVSGYTPLSWARYWHAIRLGGPGIIERIICLLENAGGIGNDILSENRCWGCFRRGERGYEKLF